MTYILGLLSQKSYPKSVGFRVSISQVDFSLSRQDELVTVREAIRELNRILPDLELGKQEKLILTQKKRMAGVLLSVERYAELAKAEKKLRELSNSGASGSETRIAA